MRQGVLISTTEHLLSVLYSMGIDNAYRGDRQFGSSHSGWQRAAIRPADRAGRHPAIPPQAPLSAASGVRFRWRTRASASAFSRTRCFRLTCDTDYPAPVGRQSIEMEVTPERYASELAFARTFGWESDLNQMRHMGLIRGASLENAVCFTRHRRPEPRGFARSRRMLPPQSAGSDWRPGVAGPSAAGPRDRRARRPRHARRAGGAHHVRPLAVRDPDLRPTGLARDPRAGLLIHRV